MKPLAFSSPLSFFRCASLVTLLATCSLMPAMAAPPVAVLTQHNDLSRTGANLNETLLTTNNVNTNQFGLLFTRPVDDEIHTQPLIMTNVAIPGKGTHNLVIVATVNDSVYAFDADDSSVSTPYWQVSFLGPNIVAPRNTDMTGACGGGYKDFAGNIGIVGTPVIDPLRARFMWSPALKRMGRPTCSDSMLWTLQPGPSDQQARW